jgi:CheY-like chemotaxis protein
LPAKPRILLVDDRAENLVALEAILSSLNQELVAASSGDEALKELLTGEFAVILLDVVMPGMDGFETAAHIKRRAKTRDIPIIFLTAATSEPDYAFRGYAAGAVDYIAKPFDPWVLRAKVSIFIELYTKNMQLHEQAELLRAQLTAGSPPAVQPLLTELSGRLAAVEDLVAVISGEAASRDDAVMTDCTARLEHRVGRLRDALDALRVGGG